jgi:hypothetical protein
MLKWTIVHAKNCLMANKIEGLGQGNKHPKEYWNCVNSIKFGLNGHGKKVSEQLFRNKDGNICSNLEENAKTVKEHFQKVYNIQNQLDPTVFDLVRQRPIRSELDDPPTLAEIRKALNSAKKTKQQETQRSQLNSGKFCQLTHPLRISFMKLSSKFGTQENAILNG